MIHRLVVAAEDARARVRSEVVAQRTCSPRPSFWSSTALCVTEAATITPFFARTVNDAAAPRCVRG
jgi:hypothetical protein